MLRHASGKSLKTTPGLRFLLVRNSCGRTEFWNAHKKELSAINGFPARKVCSIVVGRPGFPPRIQIVTAQPIGSVRPGFRQDVAGTVW